MSYVVVGVPLNLEGVVVSELLQWVYGTFTLFSIIVIICAGVGVLYHIESHLNAYFYLLTAAALIDFVLFVVFLFWGRSCVTTHSTSAEHLGSTLRCGVQDGMTLLCLTALLIWRGVTLYLVRKCGRFMSRVCNEKLINHLERQGQRADAEAWGMHPGGVVPPTSGQLSLLPDASWHPAPGVPHPTSAAHPKSVQFQPGPGYGAMPMAGPTDRLSQLHAS